jgi:hypothetical protein
VPALGLLIAVDVSDAAGFEESVQIGGASFRPISTKSVVDRAHALLAKD